MIEDSTLVFCWNILDKIKIGEKILIHDHAKKNPELFIKCCKQYIDTYGNMIFNKNYTELYKCYSFNEIKERFN